VFSVVGISCILSVIAMCSSGILRINRHENHLYKVIIPDSKETEHDSHEYIIKARGPFEARAKAKEKYLKSER